MEEKQKPFILEVDEAKNEIIQVINNAIQVHKLPFYVLDMILSDISGQIREGAKNELAVANQQMVEQKDEEVA